jgi:hypothetical protein
MDNLYLKDVGNIPYNHVSFNVVNTNVEGNVTDLNDYFIEILDSNDNDNQLHFYPMKMLTTAYLRSYNKKGIPMFKYNGNIKNIRIVKKAGSQITAGTKFLINVLLIEI